MEVKDFLNKDSIIDLSFFNFSNAVTAAYFANKNLEVIKVNSNFKKFFPVLENVTNILFPSILDQLGVPKEQIDNFEKELKENGKVIIPKIEINIDGKTKIYSLLSAYTENENFPYLNGIQGQFVDRTEEYNLRKEKEELLDQKLRDQEIIEEKTKKLENIANRLAKYLSPQVYTVHDSIGFYIRPRDMKEVIPKLVDICANPETKKWFGFEMKHVNMKVSPEIGITWSDLKDYDPDFNYEKLL